MVCNFPPTKPVEMGFRGLRVIRSMGLQKSRLICVKLQEEPNEVMINSRQATATQSLHGTSV